VQLTNWFIGAVGMLLPVLMACLLTRLHFRYSLCQWGARRAYGRRSAPPPPPPHAPPPRGREEGAPTRLSCARGGRPSCSPARRSSHVALGVVVNRFHPVCDRRWSVDPNRVPLLRSYRLWGSSCVCIAQLCPAVILIPRCWDVRGTVRWPRRPCSLFLVLSPIGIDNSLALSSFAEVWPCLCADSGPA